MDAYQKSLDLKGDIDRGRVHFRKAYAACHKLEGVGESIGADLNAIRDRGTAAVLLNILDPNRELQGALADGFADRLLGRDGVEPLRLGVGLVTQEVNQTQSLTLRQGLAIQNSELADARPRWSSPISSLPIVNCEVPDPDVPRRHQTADLSHQRLWRNTSRRLERSWQ